MYDVPLKMIEANEAPEWDARAIPCGACGSHYDTNGQPLACLAQITGVWDEKTWAAKMSVYRCDRPECQPSKAEDVAAEAPAANIADESLSLNR